MRWLAAHQYRSVQSAMLEVTSLGTGIVVVAIVVIAAMFLWLNRHKHSAILLIIATLGGSVLNQLLKNGFGRPRPHLFPWGTPAGSSSFPSGHAMNAVIVYSTVAYLAARLQRNPSSRALTFVTATIRGTSAAALPADRACASTRRGPAHAGSVPRARRARASSGAARAAARSASPGSGARRSRGARPAAGACGRRRPRRSRGSARRAAPRGPRRARAVPGRLSSVLGANAA